MSNIQKQISYLKHQEPNIGSSNKRWNKWIASVFYLGNKLYWGFFLSWTLTFDSWPLGLGTSTMKEAKEYFTDMARHRIPFKYDGPQDDESIVLVCEN